MRSRILSCWVASSQPATRAVPPLGGSNVASMRRVVVLPAPFGPRKPKISPRLTSRSTPATASTCRRRDLKTRRRPRVSITASGFAPAIGRDCAGRGRFAAGELRPERFLHRTAGALAANSDDRTHARRNGQAPQLSALQVGGRGRLALGSKPEYTDRGRALIFWISRVTR